MDLAEASLGPLFLSISVFAKVVQRNTRIHTAIQVILLTETLLLVLVSMVNGTDNGSGNGIKTPVRARVMYTSSFLVINTTTLLRLKQGQRERWRDRWGEWRGDTSLGD